MKIYNVTDERFKAYGKVVKDIDFSEMVRVLKEETPIPEDVAYVPGLEALESLPAGEELSRKVYGEMPIQIGYCNGHNSLLNALEYHKSSEINVAATDAILLMIPPLQRPFCCRRVWRWRCMPQPCTMPPAVWTAQAFRWRSCFQREPIWTWRRAMREARTAI